MKTTSLQIVKRSIRILLVLTVLVILSANAPKAWAATSQQYKVTSTSVAVRTKTNAKSQKLGTLKKGAKITVISKSGKWGKITYKKKSGYVTLKNCTRISTSTKKSTSNSLGTAGRLNISSVGCSVALNKGASQTIVDKDDSAACFTTNGCTIIADHCYQNFDTLESVKSGMTCTIRTSAKTTKYRCVKTGYAWNYTTDLIDDDNNSVLDANQGCVIMYTCHSFSYARGTGLWSVFYCVWQEV